MPLIAGNAVFCGAAAEATAANTPATTSTASAAVTPHRWEPYEARAEHPFIELVHRGAGAGELVGAPFWTDAALIAAAGIPTVLYGPAGEGAHAEVEWVDLASLERVRATVLRVAAAWCG